MKRNRIGVFIAFIAVVIGFIALIRLVHMNTELMIGLISLTFGLTAIMWTLKARKSLSKGSSLRKYTENFVVCIVFLVIFSIWRTMDNIFFWKTSVGQFMVYPEYFFITMAYISFVMAGYEILFLGKEFGFEGEGKKLREYMKNKKSKK